MPALSGAHFEKLFLMLWFSRCSQPYNLDTQHMIPFSGPNGSFFGYSVLLHTHQQETWVLVGAPVANSNNSAVRIPGAVYKCMLTGKRECEQIQLGMESDTRCGKTCSAEVDDQWLGVSLSRRHRDGLLLVCAHRWKNVYYAKKENKLPHGVCYRLEADLVQSTPLMPCYRDYEKQFGEAYTSCQAGISSFLLEDLVVMGAPGTSYWTGSVFVYNTSSQVTAAYLDDNTVLFGSYLGYSVSAGHFLSPGSVEVVGGAPQYHQIGRVYIFSINSNQLSIITAVTGSKLGSYFGASVCAVDLNADGLSDLLVGAPMFSSVREEGRVHVYINQGHAQLHGQEFTLAGRDSYAARFGQTISSLGDLDQDGYPDVAVGAPQEEDWQGAVYIYNGRKTGLEKDYSQRISGSVMSNAFKMFGQSVSGGIDVDGNGYPDVAVGAFLSDSAVVLRTRAVVVVKAWLLLPVSVNHSQPRCSENAQSAVCLDASVCFSLGGRRPAGSIDMLYNLTADVSHKEGLQPRLYFSSNGTAHSNVTRGRIRARQGHVTCTTHQAFLRRDVRDIFSSLVFRMQYELGGQHTTGGPALTPVLQRGEDNHNQLTNQTQFSRYCVWVNCSTNLQLSAQLVLPRTHSGVGFVALGEGKTLLLNVTLGNAGDAAFLPTLHLRYPGNLHFIKVLDTGGQPISCEQAGADETVGVDCSLGNLFLNALAEVKTTLLMEVSSDSEPGDLNITITASRENFESEDLLHDNVVNLTLPLRYGVNLNIHGFASPTGLVFGDFHYPRCHTERFKYTFKMVNPGPSLSQDTRVEISLPRTMFHHPYFLLRILHVQASTGRCYVLDPVGSGPQPASTTNTYWTNLSSTAGSYWTNLSSTTDSYWTSLSSTTAGSHWTNLSSTGGSYWTNQSSVSPWTNGSISTVEGEKCEIERPSSLEELVFFFSKRTKRHMYCMRQDALCVYVVCELGDLATGSDVSVTMEVEMRPATLDVSPGRHWVMVMEAAAMVTPRRHPHVWLLTDQPSTTVVLEAHHFYQMHPDALLFLLVASMLLGLLILTLLVFCLWKEGFFKNQYHEKMKSMGVRTEEGQ